MRTAQPTRSALTHARGLEVGCPEAAAPSRYIPKPTESTTRGAALVKFLGRPDPLPGSWQAHRPYYPALRYEPRVIAPPWSDLDTFPGLAQSLGHRGGERQFQRGRKKKSPRNGTLDPPQPPAMETAKATRISFPALLISSPWKLAPFDQRSLPPSSRGLHRLRYKIKPAQPSPTQQATPVIAQLTSPQGPREFAALS